MHIEAAAASSVDAVVTLLRAQLLEHRVDPPVETLREAVRVLLGEPPRGAVFLACDPEPVGMALLAYTWTVEHGGLVAWLEELYVVPARRGAGVGEKLLKHALGFAREAGCRAVDLEVDVEHARAEHLYAREGFSPLPRRRWSMTLTRP